MRQKILPVLTVIGLLVILLALFLPAQATPAAFGAAQTDDAPLPRPGEDDRERAASKMDEELLAQLRGAPDEVLTVIVEMGGQADLGGAARLATRTARATFVYDTLRTFADERQAAIRAYLKGAEGVVDFRPYFIFNGLAVTARPGAIWQIALRDDVQEVRANHVYQLTNAEFGIRNGESPLRNPHSELRTPEWNIEQINADDVWAQYGITGDGVLVANLDSGVEYTHPALVNQYAGNLGSSYDHNFHWYDAVNNVATPYDDNGHGTHTMGTIAGGDGPGPFADDIGVAPGAEWIAVKAFSAGGTGESDDIHAAFEWLLAPCPAGVQPGDPSCDPTKAPDVVNNSWGSSNGARTEYLPDVQALRAAGIWPAFSAGNDGPAAGTVGSPGSFAESFATGATDSGDVIAGFSSRGPSPLTDEIKPDVVAPGVDVRSSVPGGGYALLDGTSMASPHSTGLAALLLSAAPDLDLDTLEEMIRSTAVDLGPAGADMDYGYGRIDALAAMQRVASSGDLTGVVRDTSTSDPIAGAEVHAQGQGLDVTTTADASGTYSLTYLVNGPYTVTAAFYGYETMTATNVTIVTDTVTMQDFDLVSLPRHTVSGHVTDAVSPTIPITNATITVLDTPLAPVQTDATGFYSLTVTEGDATVEAAAFGYATGVTATTVVTDTTLDFALEPLPPVLLVDDDEGGQRSYSSHVEAYYFEALDANGYNYTYWDIEEVGAPDYATMRQYAAVVWFGGEFGRIKDVTDAVQAQAVMDYLDIGGRFLYVSQSHTFYYGDDSQCDTPRWGGTGPCPFTEHYLGVADWIEDQKAQVMYGVAGNPVGDGLGPVTMAYPAGITDFSDQITGTLHASLAFTATDAPGEINDVAYTVISPTAPFKTVFMATPLEAMPSNDAVDTMYAVMEWFGVSGLAEGLTLSPPAAEGLALDGDPITYTLRIRNLSPFSDTFDLSVVEATWPTQILDAGFGAPITELGPIPPQGTMDFGVVITVPAGTTPGALTTSRVHAVSQSATPHSDESELTAKARMVYYALDNDQCDSGVHFPWVDIVDVGDRWDMDEYPPLPEYVSVPLPEPFTFYNQSYDHLWINDHATILFGDDNIYDDRFPSGDPPIPNPTISDPNGALYLGWGNSYWHPADQDPDAAAYTYHDTGNGRNWFIIEYYRYPNLLGDEDTMEVILDLDTNEVTMLYQTISYHHFTVVGIENQIGTEGILYVNDQQPPQNVLHDGLAIRYGLGEPPRVLEPHLVPAAVSGTGTPNGTVEYTLALSSTGNVSDTYSLNVDGAAWPTTLWDASFTTQIGEIGPLDPCTAQDFGVRVELPPDTEYVQDVATVRARSQTDTLVAASSTITTDNAAPAVALTPSVSDGAISGGMVTHTVALTNTGNITDSYALALSGYSWPTAFTPPMTQTAPLPPGASVTADVVVDIPAGAPAGATDTATLTATGQAYPAATASSTLTTEAETNVAVAWAGAYQQQTVDAGLTAGYYVFVRNRGNVDDTFTLTPIGDQWTTTLWNDAFTQQITQTGRLGPDEEQRIGVRVSVPAGAQAPDQDAVVVRAASTVDGDVSAYTMLVTQVSGGSGDVVLAPAGAWQIAAAGDTVTYTLRVTNTGSTATGYGLTVNGAGWATVAPANTGTLAPGASTTVDVVVAVPMTAEAGAWDEVALLLASTADPAVTARADLTTLLPGVPVTPPPPEEGIHLYLPLVSRE